MYYRHVLQQEFLWRWRRGGSVRRARSTQGVEMKHVCTEYWSERLKVRYL